MPTYTDAAWQAAALARATRAGVLSTLSKRHAGHPFGSVVPYVVAPDGRLLIYISAIAEHTKNLIADPRAALTVADPHDLAADPQAGARLSVLVHGQRVPDAQQADALARYVAWFPRADGYRSAHDFACYALTAERARYIGGFGDIHWLDATALPLAHPFADQEAGVVAHMNDDHADALVTYWHAVTGAPPPQRPVLLGLDALGMDLRAGHTLVRVPFATPVTSGADVRKAVIAALDAARDVLAAH